MKAKLLITLSLFFSVSVQAETINLSTYYPAPFGAYDRLRLVPRAAAGMICNDATAGTFYIDDRGTTGAGNFGDDELRICRGGTFQSVGGVWTQNGNNVYLSDTANPNLSVGIGTTTPRSKLEVNGDVLIEGIDDTAISGIRTFFHFGYLSSYNQPPQWDGFRFYRDNTGSLAIPSHPLGVTGSDQDFHVFENIDHNQIYPDGAIVFANRGNNNVRTVAMAIQGSGNVGIGTASPLNRLSVEAPIPLTSPYDNDISISTHGSFIPGDSASFVTYFARGTVAAPTATQLNDVLGSLHFYGRDTVSYKSAAKIYAQAEANFGNNYTPTSIKFLTSDGSTLSDKMVITGTGNVGIGTTSPRGKLEVTGGSNGLLISEHTGAASSNDMTFIGRQGANIETYGVNGRDGNSFPQNQKIYIDANNGIVFRNDDASPTTFVNITSSGNVGIGSSTPQAKLDVSGSIKVGTDPTCNASTEGAIRYNNGAGGGGKRMQFCTGASWRNFGPSENGIITVPSNTSFVTINFTNSYSVAPVVIATSLFDTNNNVGMATENIVSITTTSCVIDVDRLDQDGNQMNAGFVNVGESGYKLHYAVFPLD